MKKIIRYGLIFIILISLFNAFEVMNLKSNYVKIKTKKIKGSIKIIQISDYHDSKIHKKQLVKIISKEEPDIIVITGDLIDIKTKTLDNVAALISDIIKINKKIYYVPGNHEYYSGLKYKLIDKLNIMGVKVLLNKGLEMNLRQNKINICGIDDVYTGYYDLQKAKVNINNKYFTILLSHAPDIVLKEEKIGVDLVLSGHTHGGQVRLPFIGAIVAPNQGWLPKYDKGRFKIKDGTLLFIDSGVGTSHYPIRLFNRSQISIIEIIGDDKNYGM